MTISQRQGFSNYIYVQLSNVLSAFVMFFAQKFE